MTISYFLNAKTMRKRETKQYLIEMSRKLETIVTNREKDLSIQVIDILNVLKSLEVDPLLIRNAKIILTVNNLRKTLTDEDVVKLSKNLLMKWKKSVIAENHILRNLMNHSNIRNETQLRMKFKDKLEDILKSGTTDENRLKSRDMLFKALTSDEEIKEDLLKVVKLAADIEKCIYREFNNTDTKYKIRIRSRISNISDEQNGELRRKILNGIIKVEEISTMSAEDMANDKMKQLRQQLQKDSITASILPEVFGTTSDLLKCPECKKNNCTYNQVQIDRADEPMTTLCLCISCGHRWRFN
ncbi:transcription elongation factor S-II-like [Oppia nitens]|uniref:transcription elongation factor S-II-like n=1 Tax=Oppia nitens TaxID=1686743 RepID=UPI0023DA1E4E|nr:transcription elongation factor S-II-like [Oppia nitens]